MGRRRAPRVLAVGEPPPRGDLDLRGPCRFLAAARGRLLPLLGRTRRPADPLCDRDRLHAYRVHAEDRKSTRLNSSHSQTSYAVLCSKKKTALLAVSAVSIDTSRMLSLRNELQFSADAGAHAGAIQLTEPNDPTQTAEVAVTYSTRYL